MTSSTGNKISGTILILLGTSFVFYLFYSQRLVLDNHSFLLARYFKIILASYCGFIFVFAGVSYFIGFLVPYYKANIYEKAKSNIFSSIFGLPIFLFLLIVTSVSFNNNEIRTYKIVGIFFSVIMILFCLRSFIYSLNTFKGFHRKKYRGKEKGQP
jgi:hypothetical protein